MDLTSVDCTGDFVKTMPERHEALCDPILPTSHCSSQTQLRNRSGGFYSNTSEADPVPDKAVTTTELRGGPAQHPVQDLVTTTPVTPPIKGIMASIY